MNEFASEELLCELQICVLDTMPWFWKRDISRGSVGMKDKDEMTAWICPVINSLTVWKCPCSV